MDWIYLSKLVPLFLYPLNIFFLLIALSLIMRLLGKGFFAHLSSAFALLILVVCSVPQTPIYLIKLLEHRYPPVKAQDSPTADAILILGGALGLPSHPRVDIELVSSSDRIRFATQLYQHGKAGHIIVSGGNVFPQQGLEGEAYYIAKLLVEWGVPEAAILIEESSRNTYENAIFVKPLLAQHKIETILLVTSATHMPRALAVFHHQNIKAIPATTDILITRNDRPVEFNWIPNAQALSSTSMILKEYIGWFYYRLRGYIA